MDKKSRDLVMGKLYLKNKDYKMAEKSFSEYLSSNPEDFQALKMLAQVQEHLNDTAKAFDLYQRCYLSQPDRKGVLLDICRLLLVKDPHLDQVDQKKWLDLAMQVFPTNPIVTNLRESLPNCQDTHSGKITTMDMILEKLTLLEDRFKNLEDKFDSLTLEVRSRPVLEQNTPPTVPAPTVPAPTVPAPTVLAPTVPTPTVPTPTVPTPTVLAPTVQAPTLNLASLTISPATAVSAPTPVSVATTTPVNIFGNLPKLDSKENNASKDNSFKFAGSNLFANSFKNLSIPSEGLWTTLSKDTTKKETKDENKDNGGVMTTKGFNFKEPAENKDNSFQFTTTSNLFADSLKKYNLPTEGTWASSAKETPKKETKDENNEEGGGDDDDGGVVQTEELPIENTCDMSPIEIKTGEEDEDIVFKYRCKLFRFRDKEYKERGLGDIKILKHRETGKGRLIMRRELVNLVCLNCWSCQNVERVRDTQVRFAGLDASDGEAVMTVFLAKFKTQELTDEFQKYLNELFPEE